VQVVEDDQQGHAGRQIPQHVHELLDDLVLSERTRHQQWMSGLFRADAFLEFVAQTGLVNQEVAILSLRGSG
jgi:hypothetical protein